MFRSTTTLKLFLGFWLMCFEMYVLKEYTLDKGDVIRLNLFNVRLWVISTLPLLHLLKFLCISCACNIRFSPNLLDILRRTDIVQDSEIKLTV